MFTEAHCVIRGKVQMVGFRDFALKMAKVYDLTGWVKNNDDGTVEILIQGLPDDLKACIEAFNAGPPLASVESVAAEWRTPKKQLDDFVVIF